MLVSLLQSRSLQPFEDHTNLTHLLMLMSQCSSKVASFCFAKGTPTWEAALLMLMLLMALPASLPYLLESVWQHSKC